MEIFIAREEEKRNVISREKDPARCVLGNKLNRVFSYNINIYFSSTTLVILRSRERAIQLSVMMI